MRQHSSFHETKPRDYARLARAVRTIQSYGQDPTAESCESLTTPVASRALGGTRMESTVEAGGQDVSARSGRSATTASADRRSASAGRYAERRKTPWTARRQECSTRHTSRSLYENVDGRPAVIHRAGERGQVRQQPVHLRSDGPGEQAMASDLFVDR